MANYQVPGVYVTQSGTSLISVNPTNLNIAIIADQPTSGTGTDYFYNVVATSGVTIGALSIPTVVTGTGVTVTWASGSGTASGVAGTNFNFSTISGITYLTTSGVASNSLCPSGTVTVNYSHFWGAYGTYTGYNAVVNAIGTPVSGTTVTNPAVLAAQFAFQNGARTVSILPVARATNNGTATSTDWKNVFTISGSSTNATFISNTVGVDVIVPLYGFTAGFDTVATGINTYLNTQAAAGIYQRAFLGVDGTATSVTSANMQTLASGFNSTRVSVVFPALLNYNPGLNTTTGLSNTTFNIPGYYLASAIAGVFVGQPDVSTPVTNKQVIGFNDIPNQISEIDAATNYLPYGVLTVRKKRDGNFWVLHGLTTNVTNWLTQEVSINAIGDRLARLIKTDLENSFLVGSPLTKNTSSAALGTVQGTLTNALSNGLIQSYQNLALSLNNASPTTLFVTFQYAPTYPINYVQATFSLNTQTGQVIYGNAQSNFVVY